MTQNTSDKWQLGQCLVHLAVIVLLAGQPAPAVNESHYLPKAKHAWDQSFAPGDLFLESHDSHFLASAAAGLAARFCSLDTVAWAGRLVSWALFAWSWHSLARAVGLAPWLRPLALAAWYLGIAYGHWAGEWAVGGFEAKSIAYPCVIAGLAAACNNCWHRAWLWLGLAVAWHPIVGGWAGLSVGIVWLLTPGLIGRLRLQWPALLGATCIGLIGVIPAAVGLAGSNQDGDVLASRVHVYVRLAHHLAPHRFATERHLAAAASILALTVVTGMRMSSRRKPHQSSKQIESDPLALVNKVAWIAVSFALVGLAIDQLLVGKRIIASSLLRFYWFRWADVAVPMAVSFALFRFVGQHITLVGSENSTDQRSSDNNSSDGPQAKWRGVALSCAALILFGSAFVIHAYRQWNQEIPAADRLVVGNTGRHQIETDRHIDWLAACAWIRENTPSDSVWFTPKYQQTFKWHAGRAEVVCWKDVPQDNASVHEWFRRIRRCEPPRDRHGIRGWTTDELIDLAREYDFRWILVDRSFQSEPVDLDAVYPAFTNGTFVDNRSFAIFRVPAGMLD